MIVRNETDPIRVFDGSDVFVIPDRSIQFVQLHDPESPDAQPIVETRRGIGFRIDREEG